MGFFDRIKSGLAKTAKAMQYSLGEAFSFTEIDDDFYEELEESLILADLGVDTACKAVEKLRERVRRDYLMKPDEVRRNILGTEIAYIPQAAMNALNPTRKISKFIEDVIRAHDPKANKKDIAELSRSRFAELGLPVEALDRHAVELSGGMKQRVVIAVSTILKPKVLIADEPSSALDVTSQKKVIKMLRDMMEKGYIKSMIFITHELPLLYNVTDRIVVMYAGQIVEQGTARQMVFDPIHPYSRGLMKSILVPEEGTREAKLTAIPGTPPNLKKPPQGCRFAERCRYAAPQCRAVAVPMTGFEDDRACRCIYSAAHLREVYGHEE